MIAYGTIDFTSLKFFRNIVNPIYYFVHGSFDNERTQLESRSGVWDRLSKYLPVRSLTFTFSPRSCRYDYRYTSHFCFSYAFRQYTFN